MIHKDSVGKNGWKPLQRASLSRPPALGWPPRCFKLLERFKRTWALLSPWLVCALCSCVCSARSSVDTKAAIIDDVLSLVLLAVLSELASSSTTETNSAESAPGTDPWTIVRPVVVSLAVIVVGRALAFIVPQLYRRTERWPKTRHDLAILLGLVSLTFGLSVGAGFAGSTYLLGAFVAGVAFSEVPRTIELWQQQQVLTEWLISIFFASLGFAIPVADLFEPVALGYGLIFTILVGISMASSPLPLSNPAA